LRRFALILCRCGQRFSWLGPLCLP